MNSYTTETVKDVSAFPALRARDVSAIVFTRRGTRPSARRTPRNTPSYYAVARRVPRYMRLFNDMSPHPRVREAGDLRVNGVRIARRPGIAGVRTSAIASDLRELRTGRPKHGSAPDGGRPTSSALRGIEPDGSNTLCEPWTAYEAVRLTPDSAKRCPVLKVKESVLPTRRWCRPLGRRERSRRPRTRRRRRARSGKALLAEGEVDLAPLDALTTSSSPSSRRRCPAAHAHAGVGAQAQANHWDANREEPQLARLNMMTEAKLGFPRVQRGSEGQSARWTSSSCAAASPRETWSDSFIDSLIRRELTLAEPPEPRSSHPHGEAGGRARHHSHRRASHRVFKGPHWKALVDDCRRAGGVALVAEKSGDVVGLLLGFVRAWSSVPPRLDLAVGVDPDAQGGGVGRQLMDAARSRFAGDGISLIRTWSGARTSSASLLPHRRLRRGPSSSWRPEVPT